MAQLSKVFFPYDPLPAQDLNDMVGFMNGVADGTNLEDGAITARTLAQSALDGFVETLTISFNGLTVPANLWTSTGQSIPSKYLESEWMIIPADSFPSAGLFSSYLSATGLVYVNSIRSSSTTVNGSIKYLFLKYNNPA